MDKAEIIRQINAAHADVADWFETHADRWSFAPPEKWTAGQHLEHLVRSVNPLNKALSSPKIALRLSFGKPNRPLRTLDEIEQKYRKGLAGGFKAVGPFIPPEINRDGRAALLEHYASQHARLEKVLAKWSESALDNYLLPHPALGKMMIREILYFTIIHTRHHLGILQERYETG